MIIVSQNKEIIINFSNVVGIQVDVGKNKNAIGAALVSGDSLILGKYATEERAREILLEITNTFSAQSLNETHDEIDLILKAKSMAKYEMPKE